MGAGFWAPFTAGPALRVLSGAPRILESCGRRPVVSIGPTLAPWGRTAGTPIGLGPFAPEIWVGGGAGGGEASEAILSSY